MELWIRTQNREKIKKVNGVEFIQSGSALYDGIKYSIYETDGEKIGGYETKERALEVLEEIQTIIRNKYVINFDYNVALNGLKKEDVQHILEQMAVYEMPES